MEPLRISWRVASLQIWVMTQSAVVMCGVWAMSSGSSLVGTRSELGSPFSICPNCLSK